MIFLTRTIDVLILFVNYFMQTPQILLRYSILEVVFHKYFDYTDNKFYTNQQLPVSGSAHHGTWDVGSAAKMESSENLGLSCNCIRAVLFHIHCEHIREKGNRTLLRKPGYMPEAAATYNTQLEMAR